MDKITKESEELEGVLKQIDCPPDVCFACGSGNTRVYRTNTLRKEKALPRIRECLDCGYKYVTIEINLAK